MVRFSLNHRALQPATVKLELVERADYGIAVQAPTSIFRFKPAEQGGWQQLLQEDLKRCHRSRRGDLFRLFTRSTPRFYSLASSASDEIVEICVRKQPGGLCSGILHDLKPGACIDSFIRPNPGFRPATGDQPDYP